MRERVEERLKQLKDEFEAGRNLLAELETQQESVRSTMLRISGALQVLEELLASQPGAVSSSLSPPNGG